MRARSVPTLTSTVAKAALRLTQVMVARLLSLAVWAATPPAQTQVAQAVPYLLSALLAVLVLVWALPVASAVLGTAVPVRVVLATKVLEVSAVLHR
jgi:hypothetical protein